MSPQMRIVMEIAGAGVVLLLAAFGALISLMYLLTNPILFGEPARERRRAKRRARRMKKRGQPAPIEGPTIDPDVIETPEDRLHEHDRRRRAAALAVAAACAERESAIVFSTEGPADWRLLHRHARLSQRRARQPARTYDTRRGSRP